MVIETQETTQNMTDKIDVEFNPDTMTVADVKECVNAIRMLIVAKQQDDNGYKGRVDAQLGAIYSQFEAS